MKVLNAFPSKYLRASDFENPQMLTMLQVHQEPMPDGEEKPVLYFKEQNKGLVLNITNTRTISDMVGTDDSDEWEGKQVVLFSVMTQNPAGKPVEGIRVRAPKVVKAAKPKPVETDQGETDEVPF